MDQMTEMPRRTASVDRRATSERPYSQLSSYIAHSAPATRRPARPREPFLRPEIGFVPTWFRQTLDIDFGERWHTDPAYRCDTIAAMSKETRRRFGGRSDIGIMQDPDHPADILTGTYGTVLVAGIYGAPIEYRSDDWPSVKHGWLLSDREADRLKPPELDRTPLWNQLMGQLDWIEGERGRIEGFLNWQGVLNNAFRLRGSRIFVDMRTAPQRVANIFECVTETMIEGARRLYQRQSETGVRINHYTISNCLVNMVSPNQYAQFQLPFDRRIAESFGMIGVHNCAWCADPYIDLYATLPGIAYVDMGIESDLARAKKAFPDARRAIMYGPMHIRNRPPARIEQDLGAIAESYGPCDIVFADITHDTPDDRVFALIDICQRITQKHAPV